MIRSFTVATVQLLQRPAGIACLLTLGLLATSAAEEATDGNRPAEPVGVRVGFGGRYKIGVWTPVEVLFSSSGVLPDEVTLTVADGDGIPSRVTAPVRENRVLAYVRFGRADGKLAVSYSRPDGPADEKVFLPSTGEGDFQPALPAGAKLIVTVGADSLGVGKLVAALQQGHDEQRIAVAGLDDFGQLPDQWYGYDGVDAVVLSTSNADVPAPSEAQAAALEKWITMGGRLVLSVGARAAAMLAADSPLGRFAPGRFDTVVSLRQTGKLEAFAESSIPILSRGQTDRSAIRVARLADVVGVIEAREADLPLVVRTARGFGQIIFLAADLDRPPLSDWKDRPRLAARLLDVPQRRIEETDESSAMMRFGFTDMAGQLRSALDRFEGVGPEPFRLFILVLGLTALYLLAIGPLDYFLLRRFVGRMQWTWLTFPAIVITFCVAAYFLAIGLKGREVRIHQADLIDVDTTTGLVRGTSWANVFSPRMRSFDLSLRPEFAAGEASQPADVLVSWLGLPGAALGGMNARTSNPVRWTEQYDFSRDLSEMRGVPIPVWSTKSLVARWSGHSDECLDAKLSDDVLAPSGTITNTFDFPLSNCVLAYRRWAYDLGSLEPGQSVRLGPMSKRSELKTLLIGRKIEFSKAKDRYHQQATPYEQSSVDAAYIIRTMMFFEKADGRQYTMLSNGYQNFVDLGDLLDADRAIFIAEGSAGGPAAAWLDDRRPIAEKNRQHVTLYRFVLPIQKRETGQTQ